MVLVGEFHLVVAGGDAHAAQGVDDPEELGRVAVDLDLPLGYQGSASTSRPSAPVRTETRTRV